MGSIKRSLKEGGVRVREKWLKRKPLDCKGVQSIWLFILGHLHTQKNDSKSKTLEKES